MEDLGGSGVQIEMNHQIIRLGINITKYWKVDSKRSLPDCLWRGDVYLKYREHLNSIWKAFFFCLKKNFGTSLRITQCSLGASTLSRSTSILPNLSSTDPSATPVRFEKKYLFAVALTKQY